MKKLIAILAILLMAFSFPAIAQDEGGEVAAAEEPAPPEPEPAPAEEPTPPPTEPTPLEEPRDEPVPPVEGPVTPPVPGGPGEPGSGGSGAPGSGGQPSQPGMCYLDGKEMPCDQMPRPDDRLPQPGPGDAPRPPQTGPGGGGCWVGDQQVPCPGEGPRLEEGCREVIEPNGMRRVDCGSQQRQPGQMTCTSGPERERIEQKCKEQGGRIITRNIDASKGCGIVDCVFGQEGGFAPVEGTGCPGPDELKQKADSCNAMGLMAIRVREKCEYVKCINSEQERNKCPDNNEDWERAGMECSQKGGKVMKAFDANGCNIPKCVAGGEECPKDVPQEAYWKCEDEGGKLVVNTDENGCITFSKCVKRGEAVREDEYNEIDEVPPAAKLLQVALSLESLKISFDKLSKQIEAIADYYEGEDDLANAERFRRAAGMFESAQSQIDGVKEELKMGVRGMSLEQMRDIKYKIRQISDVVMEDALYIILGGEPEGDYEYKPVEKGDYGEGFVPENELDCGADMACFEKAVRVCESGVRFMPDSSSELKIVGVDGANCRIKAMAKAPEGEKYMECKFPDFATQPLKPETLLPNCEGEMAEYAKQQYLGGKEIQMPTEKFDMAKSYEGQMMGCEKVEKGINKQGVCGNNCCEARFGESNYNCPQDCMASQQVVMAEKQPMMQKVQQVFRQEGMGGCEDEISGKSPKDVCGNECCEPREDRSNCPQDCTGEPMPDEGRFFNQQTGPAYQQRLEQPQNYIAPVEQIPLQEPVNIREGPIGPAPVQEPAETMPVEETVTEEPAVETSSGGGGEITTAAVVMDAIKELIGGNWK